MPKTPLKLLFQAIRKNQVSEVQRLVMEAGPKILKRRSEFLFPLTLAAKKNRPAVVAALLELGADPNHHDSQTLPPLYLAAEEGHAEVVKILLERGLDRMRRVTSARLEVPCTKPFDGATWQSRIC